MKKLYSILLLAAVIASSACSKDEETTASIKNKILMATIERNYDVAFVLNANGDVDPTEPTNASLLNKFIQLDLINNKLHNLEGIEYLTALKVLNCYNNQLTELDLSKNNCLAHLKLSTLDISMLPKLSSISYGNQTSDGTTKRKLTLSLRSDQQEWWWAESPDNANVELSVVIN